MIGAIAKRSMIRTSVRSFHTSRPVLSADEKIVDPRKYNAPLYRRMVWGFLFTAIGMALAPVFYQQKKAGIWFKKKEE